MKKENKQSVLINLNTTAGITLIALVLTIIVLLILAGVSISLLVGENGVLEQAQHAKNAHEQASALEEIKMEIGASHGTDGKIDIEKLNKNLSSLGVDANIESLPSENIDYKGRQYIIEKDGSITVIDNENTENFDAEEWDKTAADQDCFIWQSDVEGEEGYGTVIGYTKKIDNYTKLRYPSRCTKIEFSDSLNYEEFDTARSRGFTNNILKVELPETVTKIGDEAFGDDVSSSFKSMESIVIPDSVTYIGTQAFGGCNKLTNIIIPESVTYIGSCAFARWTSSQTIYCRIDENEKPSGWSSIWDCVYYVQARQAQLVWGYTGE